MNTPSPVIIQRESPSAFSVRDKATGEILAMCKPAPNGAVSIKSISPNCPPWVLESRAIRALLAIPNQDS